MEDARARNIVPPSTPWNNSFNHGHPRNRGIPDVQPSSNNENLLAPPQGFMILDLINKRHEDKASQRSGDNQDLSEERPVSSKKVTWSSAFKSMNKTFL